MRDAAEGARILVVDDDAGVREFVSEALTMAGYSVEVVADGASAQQQLERSPRPQLVLTDVDMPGLSGLELRAWIRHRHGLPVVLMSGRIDLGMPGPGAGFLAKPLSPGRLLDVVRAALAR